jgi:hypothetical protein
MNEEIIEIFNFNSESESIFDAYKIDISKKPKTYVPLLSIKGSVIMSRCGISAITGKAKSRKSTLMLLLCQKYLTETDGKVMIIDTEMAEYYVHRNTVRLHKMMNWNVNNERVITLQFRGMNTEKRFGMFTKAVSFFKPDLIFLDGVRDLLVDFNSIDETIKVSDELMRLTELYKCHVCCILHENKNDSNMRGHLGTEIQNKAETVIGITKSGDESQAEPRVTRNYPFDSFDFGINKEGLPIFLQGGMIEAKYQPIQTSINPNRNIEPNTNFENEYPF